jgi:hypothetical protein
MSNLPCPTLPTLSVSSIASADNQNCEGGNLKEDVSCSEVLIKFGEVEVTQKIEMKVQYFSSMGPPKLGTSASGSPSYKFKFDDPKYLAGTLVQLHDYFASNKIVGDPEITTVNASYKRDGTQGKTKLFKKTPWEYFGSTANAARSENWDFGNTDYNRIAGPKWEEEPINDFFYNPNDLVFESDGLRQAYLYEASELVKKLKKKEQSFKDYFNSQAIKFVDYTNEMRLLWALAALGQLPFDSISKKFRIGNSTNPGYTRDIKIVFNLYVKAMRAEMSSVCGTTLTEVKLNGVEASKSLKRPKKTCLKCLIVLNNQDTEINRDGVYFFGVAWNKGNPKQTFLERVREAEPAHGIGSKKADSKNIATFYSDAYVLGNRFGPSEFQPGDKLKQKSLYPDIIVFEDDLNPWGRHAVTRVELLKFLAHERQGAYTWELAEGSGANPNHWAPLDKKFWTQNNQSRPIMIARPHVKQRGDGGTEIIPGLKLYFTAGQNITSGDIQGSSVQMQVVFPLEAFAVLGEGPLTLESLPGKFMNFFSAAIFVVKIDVVQGVKDTYAIVNWWEKMEAAKEALRKMKEYVESLKAKVQAHTDELTKAFEARDLNKYNEVLNSLRALAADFQQKTGHSIDLTVAIQGGKNLQMFIDAQNQLQNEINSQLPDSSRVPEAPNPPQDEAQPENPPVVSPEQVLDSSSTGNATDALVIPIPLSDPIGTNPPAAPSTPQPIDPIVFFQPIDTPSLGSTHNLGVIGHPEQSGPGFVSDGTAFEQIPGIDLGEYVPPIQLPSWYLEGDF